MSLIQSSNTIMNDFTSFIKENNLVRASISLVVSTFVYDLLLSFGNNILLPLINFDINKNNKPDFKELKNIKITLLGKQLKIGAFMSSLIKFIVMTTIVFIIYNLNKK